MCIILKKFPCLFALACALMVAGCTSVPVTVSLKNNSSGEEQTNAASQPIIVNGTNSWMVWTNSFNLRNEIAGDQSDFTTKTVGAVVAVFLGWLLTNLVGFFVIRNRLVSYLIIGINSHLEQCVDNRKWLEKVKAESIREGEAIEQSARYAADQLEDLTAMRVEILKYLWRSEVEKVTKLTKRLWELEELLVGFCETLEEHHKSGAKLDADKFKSISNRLNRILSYMQLLPNEIRSLEDLPSKYNAVIGAESLVSAKRPPN